MKKKLLASLLAVCTAVGCAFGLVGCSKSNNNQTNRENGYSYATAYAQAQALGYAGTLEEFIDMISGKDGKDGVDGKDGLTPHIRVDGYWYIGETNTGVKAVGTDGTNGVDGNDGKDGADGKDGLTPHIGGNGNWFIGDTDTGVKAVGTDGTNGVDGNDGKDGAEGTNGQDGKDGVSIKDAHIDHNGHLIIVLTNNEEIDCGIVSNEQIHEYGEWMTVSEASCKNIGYQIRVCETCNLVETRIIPKTEEHDWSKWQADGDDNHTRECSVCQKIESAPHNVNEDDVCTDCGKYFGEPISLIVPLQGEIVTHYDFGKDVTLGHWRFHTGVDIAANAGTQVVAAMDGTVESIEQADKIEGAKITIAHPCGLKVVYVFIDVKPELKVGDKVKQGDILGTVSAANGNEYLLGDHIHLEILSNGKTVDPEQYIDFGNE